MEIKLNAVINGVDGKPLNVETKCVVIDEDHNIITENGEPLMVLKTDKSLKQTLKDFIKQSLLAGKKDQSVSEKVRCYDIYEKVVKSNDKIDLESEEIVLIKSLIKLHHPILVMGQCLKHLENKK
jgi:hypothetical protein